MNYYVEVLKKYAVFSGRATRKEYWMFVLYNVIISIIIGIISGLIFGKMPDGSSNNILGGIYGLAVLLPSLGVFVRRMHDIGRSGWWILIGLIPLIGLIISIVFLVQKTKPGDSKYGSATVAA